MNKISDTYFKSEIILSYVVLMPIFSFFFMIGFKPFNLTEALELGVSQYAFICAIIMAIQLVVNALSRSFMYIFRKHTDISMFRYMFWEFCEVIVLSMFISLFIWLITKRYSPYFSILPSVILYSVSILVFPYVILSLIAENKTKALQLAESYETIEKYQNGTIGADRSPVHFTDEKGRMKLMVTADSILYIEGADNYVNICYLESGKMTRFSLRNTMQAINEICINNNLVRCHRSYYVNLRKVRILKKDKEMLYAELEHEGAPRIPVSKTYSAAVVEKFSLIND